MKFGIQYQKIKYVIIAIIFFSLTFEIRVHAAENSYDMQSVKEGIDSLFPQYDIDLDHILSMIIKGQVWEAIQEVFTTITSNINGELSGIKTIMVSILILGILSALFSNFSDIFAGQQISQVGFYFVYLLLMAVLTKAFLYAADIAVETIEDIVLFIRIFVPTYYVAVGAATGITTATFSYQVVLMIVYCVETFLLSALLPFLYSYVILALINGIWTEERLELILDLIKKGIAFVLKISIGTITGIGLIQSIITPVIDGIRKTAVQKVVSFIPGIGNIAEGAAEMVIGSAVLIKNSIGVLLLLVLVAVCVVPLLKLLAIAVMIKVSAALVGVIGDKRIINCTDRVGDASLLLLRTAFTAVALFFIIIAVAAHTTS